MSAAIETDVVIVGAGPVGVTIANLLGVYGIGTVVIDRSEEVLPYPRAVGMDDEALRVFQAADLAEPLLDEIIQNVPLRLFDRKGRAFANIRPGSREYGFCRRNIFMQQLAERTLRGGLQRFEHVRMLLGREVIAHAQDAQGIALSVRDADGGTSTLRARYCVAADGGRSTMRALLGVQMLGQTHPIKWLVVDVCNAAMEAPYTALNCNPARPNVCIYLPFNYRRWEFMVFPHENEDEIASEASIRRLISPYVTDPATVQIVRSRIYTHHSKVADRFVVGRTVLAGDAAHLSPPWIGQGLNAGLRDAGNIAWKLALLLRHGMEPATILQSYQAERQQHAKAMIDLADTFGRLLMPTSRVKAWLRDGFFRSIGRIRSVRNWVLEMRFKPMPRYGDGGLVVPRPVGSVGEAAIGHMFIQPEVEVERGRRVKLDNVLGSGFAVLSWEIDPAQCMDSQTLLYWQNLGARFVRVVRSRSGRSRDERLPSCETTKCIEDVDNLLADWFERQGVRIVVLRPDRYVAIAAADTDELAASTATFQALIGPLAGPVTKADPAQAVSGDVSFNCFVNGRFLDGNRTAMLVTEMPR